LEGPGFNEANPSEQKLLCKGEARNVFRSRLWRTSSCAQAAETVMAVYRPDIPPHVAQLIRHFPPELKRSVKQAVRSLSSNPFSGEPLLRELAGLWKYKGRRFRLLYRVDRKARLIRIFAIGHRPEVN